MRRLPLQWVALVAVVLLTRPAVGQAPPLPPAPPPGAPVDVAPTPLGAPVATDTLRALPAPDVVAAYRADPDYQYDRPEAQGPSLWDRFLEWFYRTFLEPVFRNTSGDVVQWTLVGLALLLLAWVTTRLLRTEGAGVFSRGGGPATAGPLLDVEDIEAVDLRGLLDRAEADGAWREAVRLRYLLLLQEMAAAGAIGWRPDKTNRAYGAEVRAARPALARPFDRATRVFDYVWYGERPVDRARYAALAPLFDEARVALGVRPLEVA